MNLKNIYLIVGPSGSGKTTIANELEKRYGLKVVESYTTRPPRYDGEKGHIFVSDEEFDALGPMCAYTEYDGYRYGVTDKIVDESDIYVIDPAGVKWMEEQYHGEKDLIVIRLLVDDKQRFFRMYARGDDDEKLNKRLLNDVNSFGPDAEKGITYDLWVTNNDFERCLKCIASFIENEEETDIIAK